MKPLPFLAAILPLCQAAADTFTNPVVYEDFADNDVFLGPDGSFYFSASNMHYSPGAPLLRSPDLVSWELISHSVPTLDFGAAYNLTSGHAYRGGTWASTLRYRPSTSLWYWIGCIDFWNTFIYTAPAPTGPWTRAAQLTPGTCYYDCELLVDEPSDTLYVVYGSTNVSVARLTPDGLAEESSAPVLSASDIAVDALEGNRFYKRDGAYYILNDHPGHSTYLWRATDPFGPYTPALLVKDIQSPIPSGGAPHQGSLIETAAGEWFYMSFTWAYPAGRIPVLAPLNWPAEEDFPTFPTEAWEVEYPRPAGLAAQPGGNWTGTEGFAGPGLGPQWEWNHNPDPAAFVVDNGLTLSAVTVTDDLYAARNTLTHRVHGEFPVGTVVVDFKGLGDGDVVGLAAFRDRSAWIGVVRDGEGFELRVVHNVTQDEETWDTVDKGEVVASAGVEDQGTRVWLRVEMDARASGTREARFSYSWDGEEWVGLGEAYEMWTNWAYFMGYRFGIFHYATKALGGSVVVEEFTSA